MDKVSGQEIKMPCVATKELWDEKITDSLNYLFLLAAIIKEEGTYEQN